MGHDGLLEIVTPRHNVIFLERKSESGKTDMPEVSSDLYEILHHLSRLYEKFNPINGAFHCDTLKMPKIEPKLFEEFENMLTKYVGEKRLEEKKSRGSYSIYLKIDLNNKSITTTPYSLFNFKSEIDVMGALEYLSRHYYDVIISDNN